MLALLLTLALMVALVLLRYGIGGLLGLLGLRFQAPLLPIMACIAQSAGVASQQYRSPWLLLSCVCLSWFCWRNRVVPGICLVFGGLLLNGLVMQANHGFMPLDSALLVRTRHSVVKSGTPMQWSKDMVLDDTQAQLAWLGDRLTLPHPLDRLAAWSIGDCVLLLGVARLLFATASRRLAFQPNYATQFG